MKDMKRPWGLCNYKYKKGDELKLKELINLSSQTINKELPVIIFVSRYISNEKIKDIANKNNISEAMVTYYLNKAARRIYSYEHSMRNFQERLKKKNKILDHTAISITGI